MYGDLLISLRENLSNIQYSNSKIGRNYSDLSHWKYLKHELSRHDNKKEFRF